MVISYNRLILVIILLLISIFWGCEKDGPLERAGEKVDNAIEKAGDNIEDATDKN